MSISRTITVVGNLTGDPELKYLQSGVAVAEFSVADTPRRFNKQLNEWEDEETVFFRARAWGTYAENVAASLTKGTRVLLVGSFKSRSYQKKDGTNGFAQEIDVEEIGPVLRYASAVITRNPSNNQGGGNQGGNQGGYQNRQNNQGGGNQGGYQNQGGNQGGPWNNQEAPF